MIRRSVEKHNRSAKNYGFKIAQSRLNESMPVVKQMLSNAARVNSAPILYFSVNNIGVECSCRLKTAVGDSIQKSYIGSPVTKATPENVSRILTHTKGQHVSIKHKTMLFGEDEIDDSPDLESDIYDENSEDLISDTRFILGESVDCGVCYRTGVLPGYDLIGAQSSLITMASKNIIEVQSYHLDTVSTPERFVRLHESGYIKISCAIPFPQHIHRFLYSLRDNKDVLLGGLLYDANNKPILSKNDVLANTTRVKTNEFGSVDYCYEWLFTFYVKEPFLTHICIHALSDMSDKLYANISEESLSLDYNTINTLSNITLTIPANLHKVKYGDLIYIPKRNLTLKISDFSRKNTVDFDTWEYTVSTRQLQPQETLLSLPIYDEIPMM